MLTLVHVQLAGVAKRLGLARLDLGTDRCVVHRAHLVACGSGGGGSRASGIGNQLCLVVGVLAVEHIHLTGVAECLRLARLELGADGLEDLGAHLVAHRGRRGDVLALRVGDSDKVGIGVLAVVVLQLAGVTEGLVQAVNGLGTHGLVDSRTDRIALGGGSGSGSGLLVDGNKVLAIRLGNNDKVGVGVLAVEVLELAGVTEDLVQAIDGLGAHGLVDVGADSAALGTGGGGHGGEDSHRGGNGQGDQGGELHC